MEDLEDSVGGEEELDALSTEPLPDEPLTIASVPDGIRGRGSEVAELVDGCADGLFDIEFRTACRRCSGRSGWTGPD
jgi:hypothetical protein